MTHTLFILKDGVHIGTCVLEPGMRLLGVTKDADLFIARAPSDVCYVSLEAEGKVLLRALPHVPLMRWNSEPAAEIVLTNGAFAEAAGLRLTLLCTGEAANVQADVYKDLLPTAKSDKLHAPPEDPLVLRITTERGIATVAVDAPRITIGRSPQNTVRIAHAEVSAHHSTIVRRPDGP